MPPNPMDTVTLLAATSKTVQKPVERLNQSNNKRYKFEIVWVNVVMFVILHTAAVYGVWLAFSRQANWITGVYMYAYGIFCGLGITAGAHRLWAHRTYKAKLPLRILLMIMQSTALQNHIYEWSRDHRVHHKFTETDADPHNAKRGFFFSHVGWLMLKKHKDVITKGKTLDFSDLKADPVVMFQKKYYFILAPVFCFLIPSAIPVYCWGETWWNSFFVAGVLRYMLSLNYTWLVNSAAHMFGSKPYNKSIKATENRFVSFVANGEGWHNFHHVFPWDYKAAELGNYRLNLTTAFLDFMARIGWAYDLKTVSDDMVRKRAKTSGDGSWVGPESKENDDNDLHHSHDDMLWGWGDKDMTTEEIDQIHFFNNLKSM